MWWGIGFGGILLYLILLFTLGLMTLRNGHGWMFFFGFFFPFIWLFGAFMRPGRNKAGPSRNDGSHRVPRPAEHNSV